MNERITFRLNEEMRDVINQIHVEMGKDGLDLDDSKVIRFLINKGIEKLKLEGKLK